MGGCDPLHASRASLIVPCCRCSQTSFAKRAMPPSRWTSSPRRSPLADDVSDPFPRTHLACVTRTPKPALELATSWPLTWLHRHRSNGAGRHQG